MIVFFEYLLLLLFLTILLPELLTWQLVSRAASDVQKAHAAFSHFQRLSFRAALETLPAYRPLFLLARASCALGIFLLAALVVLYARCTLTGSLLFPRYCTSLGTIAALIAAVLVVVYRALLAKNKK